jgi:hypothetical protein
LASQKDSRFKGPQNFNSELKSKLNAYDKSDDYTLGQKFLQMVSGFVENDYENSAGSFMLHNSPRHSNASPKKNISTRPGKNAPNKIAQNAIAHMNENRILKAQKRGSIYDNKFTGPRSVSHRASGNFLPLKNPDTPALDPN